MRQITANKVPLLNAFQETQSAVGAVAHVYARYAIARSLLPDLNVDDILPPYARAFRNHATLQGRTAFLFMPRLAAMAGPACGPVGGRSVVIPVNQRPVRCRQELGGACQAKEELEATSRLALRTCGLPTNALSTEQITADVCLCKIDWKA